MNDKIYKYLGLVIAIFGVIIYRELPMWWCLLAWIPINVGYGMYWNYSTR